MRSKCRWLLFLLLPVFLTGCHDAVPGVASPARPEADLAIDHDPAQAGAIVGKVVWEGPIPAVSPFTARPSPNGQPDMPPLGARANPHAPRVNPGNRGVAQAVVFLRQVDVRKSRPWDHAPVRVEHEDWSLRVRQGQAASSVGFVRRGTAFSAISKQKVLHLLRGEGEGEGEGPAFFVLPLPDREVATARILDGHGHVELSSAADYFWMRAHLFVDDHPYYASSDADGQFALPQVPAGDYQIVCWLPNWKIAWQERNPESSLASRVGYQPPLEMARAISVTAGQSAVSDFVISQKSFGP